MKKLLQNIVNIHKGIPCVIIGSAPSLVNFSYNNFKGQIISVGDSAIRLKNICKFDYWVNSNNEFPIPEIPFHLDIINNFKDYTFVFSDTVAYDTLWHKDNKFLEENILPNWLVFDERHFNKTPCVKRKNCCDILKENMNNDQYKTIQEFVAEVYSTSEFPSQGGTVAEYGLALALILGCNPIYIQGVDIPLTLDEYISPENSYVDNILRETDKLIADRYFKYYSKFSLVYPYWLSIKNKIKNTISRKSVFSKNYQKIMNNFQILSNIAKKENIKIFILSENSNLNKIDGFSYMDYRDIK